VNELLVTIRLSMGELEALIGAATKLYEYTPKQLVEIFLDSEKTDKEGRVSLYTALASIGILVRKHFIEMILQIDKEKLTPDAAMLLASIKGKHKIEEQRQ